MEISKARFLEPSAYQNTRALADLCFHDDAFFDEYYGDGGEAYRNRIIVKEADGKIVSMAHLVPRKAWYKRPDGTEYAVDADYIAMVATDPAFRHRGFMDEVLKLALDAMKQEGKPWTFLIAVDKNIYRHLGFVYDWKFRKEETNLLYADDGLTDCSACLLCADEFQVPLRLSS